MSHLIESLKDMMQFRYSSEYEGFQENPSSVHHDFDQPFWQDMHEETLLEYAHFFYTYLLQINSNTKMDLKSHLYNLVTLSFKVTQRDLVAFKKLGVQMLSQVIEIFKDTVEKLGDEEDSDENDQRNERAGNTKAPGGPLLLEQYEAQIHSVIRSSLQEPLQSFMYMKELGRLTEQFLTLGICQDDHIKQKAIEQLQDIYVSKSARAARGSKAQRAGKDLDYFTLSQMYPEKICANAYMQQMALINKISSIFNADMEESYVKVLKDFLIITCAQAQDAKNPNCIKDIKSLKILYPSGLGCAVDMKYTIDCAISILKLRDQNIEQKGEDERKQAAPSEELIDLTFQCALLLLNSSPESLLLTGENDALEAIKIRIEVLSWLCDRMDQSRPGNDADRLQKFFSHQLFGQLFMALKGNFELGVLQISHQVIRVYARILEFKKSGQIFDLHVDDICQQILTLSASVES